MPTKSVGNYCVKKVTIAQKGQKGQVTIAQGHNPEKVTFAQTGRMVKKVTFLYQTHLAYKISQVTYSLTVQCQNTVLTAI